MQTIHLLLNMKLTTLGYMGQIRQHSFAFEDALTFWYVDLILTTEITEGRKCCQLR